MDNWNGAAQGMCLMLATVLSNNDKNQKGLLKIQLVNGEDTVLTGVKTLTRSAGKNYGAVWLPEIGEQVVIGFLDGCADCPLVLGSLFTASDEMLTDCCHEKNAIRRFRTKSGTLLECFDEKGKERIKVKTPKHITIEIDEETQTVTVAAKKTRLILNGKSGKITLDAEKELLLQSGSAKLSMKSDGTISLGAGKVDVNAKSAAQIKSSGTLTLKGQKNELSGSMVEVKSSGILTLKGSMTKIN